MNMKFDGRGSNLCHNAQKGRFKLPCLDILNSLSYVVNISFNSYDESQVWALGDTGKLYFFEDMLQKVFVVPTLSLHSNGLVQALKLLDND